MVAPPAPQPTMTASSSSPSSKRRMSVRSRWLVRSWPPGSNQADSFRRRTESVNRGVTAGHRVRSRPVVGERRQFDLVTTATRSGRPGTSQCSRLPTPRRLIAPRIGGSAESDLVPGPRMGVEGGARVAGPERPDVGRLDAVPLLAVVPPPARAGLGTDVERMELDAMTVFGIPVQQGQRNPPGVRIPGHVYVDPAIGLVQRQPAVHQRQNGNFGWLRLGEQQIEQRAGRWPARPR